MRTAKLSPARGPTVLLLALLLLAAGCEEGPVLEVAWSPDGHWLAYVRGTALYVARVTEARALKAEPVARNVVEPYLSWSPGSRELLFTSTEKGGWDVWRARLTDDGRWEPERVTSHPAKDWGGVFLPDGERIAFLSFRGEQCDIWVQPGEGGEARALTRDAASESALSFGFDRALLYFLRTPDGEVYQLRAVDVNFAASGVVAEGLAQVTEASASPGHRRVAVVTGDQVTVYWVAPARVRGSVMDLPVRSWSRVGSGRGLSWSAGGEALVFVDDSGWVRVVSFEGRRPAWDRRLSGRLPRLDPEAERLAFVVESSFDAGEVADAQGAVVPDLLLVSELASGDYQCVYVEEPTLLAGAQELAARGDFEAEAALLKTAAGGPQPKDTDPALFTAYILALAKTGQADEALELAQSRPGNDYVVGLLALAYTRDYSLVGRALTLADDAEARELAWVLGDLDERGRELFSGAVRSELEGRRSEALAAYRRLLDRRLSDEGRSVAALRTGRLQEELGRSGDALKSYRWVVRHGHPPEVVAEALGRAASVAEQLGLREEALELARMGSLHAKGPREVVAATLDEVSLSLETGGSADRERAAALVREELLPVLAGEVLDWDDKLASVYLLDLYGEHELANELLTAIFQTVPATESALLGVAAAASPWLPSEAVFEVKVESVPRWLARRLELSAEGLGEQERTPLKALVGLAQAPADLSPRLWSVLEAAAAGLSAPEASGVRLAGRYILGNQALNAGRTAEALAHFARLCELAQGPADADHFRQLAEFAAQDGEAVEAWLLALRDSRLLFWGKAGEVVGQGAGLFRPAEMPVLSAFADRLPAPPVLARPNAATRLDVLDRFSLSHPDWPFRAALDYRRAQLLEGQRRAEALRALLSLYPNTPFWHDARKDLVETLSHVGNHWLAARWLEGLVPLRPNDRELFEQIGDLHRSPLGDFVAAVPWTRKAADAFRGEPRWPSVQWTLMETLGGAELWDEQVDAVGELIDQGGDCERVKSGDAQLALARALEHARRKEEAEAAYFKFIDSFHDRPEVRDGTLLVELIPRLSISGLLTLRDRHPGMLWRALPELSRADRRRVQTIIGEASE